jgi:hypothetical protein
MLNFNIRQLRTTVVAYTVSYCKKNISQKKVLGAVEWLVVTCRICKKKIAKKIRKNLERKKTYLRLETHRVSSPRLSLSFSLLPCCTCCPHLKPMLL